MIPKQMDEFLHEVLPESSWRNRLQAKGPLRFIEFRSTDPERLHRLGVKVDRLGPRLVVCMWDEESRIEAGGYLVVDNLAMRRPSMGGIRMLPDITPLTVFNLARGMTLKNAAAGLPFGGGKAGIVGPGRTLDPDPAEHTEIVRRFARLLYRYRDIYLPGPDVGTDDADMKTIAVENGLDCAVSKPVDMGGNRIDQLGAAAGGVVIAIATLLEEMPRLKALPQFANLVIPEPADLTVLIQGFGAVGAHAARMLAAWPAPPRIIGISDAGGYLYDEQGLPIEELLAIRDAANRVTYPYFAQRLAERRGPGAKFATAADDLLRESAFCLVPAAPVAHYLGTEAGTHPSMTVDRAGRWALIVEGANTYSPDPSRRAARMRMERAVYWQRGTLIAPDFLVNSGGVIFAAQEQVIPTPSPLSIPPRLLGNPEAVDPWLAEHCEEFARLAERRLQAGINRRDEIIRRNMKELVDSLVADPDLLPVEAAEQISIRRIASSEAFRCVADVMEPLQSIPPDRSVRDAAQILISDPHEMLAIVSAAGVLVGVVTDWDITKASATACVPDVPVAEIMSREVITAKPGDNVIDVVRMLETHEISAMPVVDQGAVVGVVSTDILAHKTLYRLLQARA